VPSARCARARHHTNQQEPLTIPSAVVILAAAPALAAAPCRRPAIARAASPRCAAPLPYGDAALEPGDLGPHHRLPLRQAPQGLFDQPQQTVAGTDMAEMSLEKVMPGTAGVPEKAGVFNNAAQSGTTPSTGPA